MKSDKKDMIPGGLADNVSASSLPGKQLKKGIRSEMEHTTSKSIAKEIAKDHIVEDKKYYDKLEKMEKDAQENIMKNMESIVEGFYKQAFNLAGLASKAKSVGKKLYRGSGAEAMHRGAKGIHQMARKGQVANAGLGKVTAKSQKHLTRVQALDKQMGRGAKTFGKRVLLPGAAVVGGAKLMSGDKKREKRASGDMVAYKSYFQKKLRERGASSPKDVKNKKKFFNEVDKGYEANKE